MTRHRFALVALVALTLVARPVAAQSTLDPHAEKIRTDVSRIGTSAEISVLRKGDDYHGVVTKIDVATFDVADVDLHQTITVSYAEVQKVRSGYDERNLFTGRHTSHPRGMRLSIFVGALVGIVVVLPLVALSQD